MTDTDLRDHIAAAIRADLQRAVPPWEPIPGVKLSPGMGRTEFDLADAALRVVQAELDRLREELALATAHDRQPYPTADAYQQACAALEQHRQRADQAEAERDGAYRERAQLLAELAARYPAVLAPAPDVDEPGWTLLYVALPTGQASWHQHPRDADLFGHVEHVEADDPCAQWDGHTTEEKYERLAQLATMPPQPDADEWIRCARGHCPNAERFRHAEQRGWTPAGWGTWCCPKHPVGGQARGTQRTPESAS